MTGNGPSSFDPILGGLQGLLASLEALYKDVHSHPELSMQETRTAGLAAERLKMAGFEVSTGIEGRAWWACCVMATRQL